jgi:hypothetical protein
LVEFKSSLRRIGVSHQLTASMNIYLVADGFVVAYVVIAWLAALNAKPMAVTGSPIGVFVM